MQKFYDLTFSRQPDGSIRLVQSDCGEDYIIDLHPAQLRHVAESFGLVAPAYPADELSKRLARQLCEIQKGLAEECHRSPWLQMLFTKLDAYCISLPDDIFPHDLWDDGAPDAQEAVTAPVCSSNGSHPSRKQGASPKRVETAAHPDDGQLPIAGL